MKKLLKYIEPIWQGNDGKMSLRSVLAIALTVDFIINVHNSAVIVIKVLNLISKDKNVDAAVVAAMTGNLGQNAIILGLEVGLIIALLGLKALQSNAFVASQTETNTPPIEQAQ